MTLLNALLAFGALAFTVPLAIHLLFRSRFTTLDWGAMHLLDSVVRINRRRIQLMNLLLLLLRCLLPILLAFCLARPVLTGSRSLPGDAPQSLVIAVDDSRSMSVRDPSGMTRMERVKIDLRQIVGELSRRDEVILIRSSRVAMPAASMGSQDAMRRIAELDSNAGPLDLDRLLRAAVEASADASHPQRRIVVASDFQSRNVGDNAIDSLRRLSTSIDNLSTRPTISFLNYGVDSDQLDNVSVDSVEVESPAVVAGRGAVFSARIRNSSDRVSQDLRLVWSIDGTPQQPRTISIPPRSTATSRLTHRIEEPGIHPVTLAVESADSLTADNRRSIAVNVVREINVLLVDGKPSSRPLEGETDFLAIALSPFAFGGEDLPDAVRTRVVTVGQLGKSVKEKQPDIVVLANVQDLRDQASVVADFVLAGGSLVVFDGDAMDTDSYNSGWKTEDQELILPASLGEVIGESDPHKAKPIPIGDLNAQYTPWSLLESKDQQPLSKVDIYRYRKLTPVDAQADESQDLLRPATSTVSPSSALPPTITLLSMGNGDPLVVSARRGQGQVVQFAIPCDADWTTLPVRMVYLPMIQQLMLDLAGSQDRTTIQVGEGFAVPVSELAAVIPEGKPLDPASSSTYTLQLPDGDEKLIQPSDEIDGQIVVQETVTPGVYRIRQTTNLAEGEPLIASTIRVVEVPKEESQLRDTESSRLQEAAESVGAEIYGDVVSLQSDDRTRRFGREIWRLILIALLIGMIGELFLQQRWIRRSGRAVST